VRRFDLVLFGDPVSHSLSPVLHEAALEAAGLTGSYRVARVDRQGLERGCDDLRAGRLDGANVTMPHKTRAAGLVDERSPGAQRAQSVNTIVVDDVGLMGHSTDIDGVNRVWAQAELPADGPVLILGAGGAAAAALIALEYRDVHLAARRTGEASTLLQRLAVTSEIVPWGRVVPGAVVVNATPIGMQGDSLPAGIVEESAGLLDMPYRKGVTPAVREARRLGLPNASGTDLLVAQAAASFALWTGQPAPVDEMRNALQKAQATV
jgi:shikimate dehydrogenase